jgi:hypothetical protein
MIISLDYDDTFTKDPDAWLEVANTLRAAGHTIYGITMRYPEETVGMSKKYLDACDKIFFTSRKAKWQYLTERGLDVDVWIDDSPHYILRSAQ